MTISDEVVEAALNEWGCYPPRTELVTKMLEAARTQHLRARAAAVRGGE